MLRKRAQMKLKIRAMSSESKASAYIVGSLPFIVFTLVWMINPHYMAGFFTDQRLMVAGIGGLVLDEHRRLHHGQDGQLRDLRGNVEPCSARTGPTLLGFDVIWIATMLSAVATFAVLLAIYAATTVKDPMARRVKALNERREQLKAGIVASTNKRKKLTNRNEAADNVRGSCRSSRCFRTTSSRRPSCA